MKLFIFFLSSLFVGEAFCNNKLFNRAYRSQKQYPKPDNEEFKLLLLTVDIVNMTKDYSLDMSEWKVEFPFFTVFNGNNHTLYLLYNASNDSEVNNLGLFYKLLHQRIYNLNIEILSFNIYLHSYLRLDVKSLFGDIIDSYIYDLHIRFVETTYLIQSQALNGVICNRIHKSTFLNVGITFDDMVIQLDGNSSHETNKSFGLICGINGAINEEEKKKKRKSKENDYDSDTLTYFIGVYIKGNKYSLDSYGDLHGGAMIGITNEKIVFSYCIVLLNYINTITSPNSLTLSLYVERSFDYVNIIKSIAIIKNSMKLYMRSNCILGGFIGESKYNVIIISSWVYITIEMLAPGKGISMGGLVAESNLGLCLVKNSYIIVHLIDDNTNIPYVSGLFGSIASNRLIIFNTYLYFDISNNITIPFYLNDIENLLSRNVTVSNSYLFSNYHQNHMYSNSNITIIEYNQIRDNLSVLMDHYLIKSNEKDERMYYEEMPYFLDNHIYDPDKIFSNADLEFLVSLKDKNNDIIIVSNNTKPVYVTTTIPPYEINDFSQLYYILSFPKDFELLHYNNNKNDSNNNKFVYLHMTSTDYCIDPIKYKKLLNPYDSGYVEENSIDLDVSSCTEYTNITVVITYYIENEVIQKEQFVIFIGANPHYPSDLPSIMVVIFVSFGSLVLFIVFIVFVIYKYKKYIDNKEYEEEKFVLESHFVVDYPLIDP